MTTDRAGRPQTRAEPFGHEQLPSVIPSTFMTSSITRPFRTRAVACTDIRKAAGPHTPPPFRAPVPPGPVVAATRYCCCFCPLACSSRLPSSSSSSDEKALRTLGNISFSSSSL
jgi:hypothetical protein